MKRRRRGKGTRSNYGHVTIYALKDPSTEQIFYVGRSKNAQSRYKQHMVESKKVREAGMSLLESLFGFITNDKQASSKSKNKDDNSKKIEWINRIVERGDNVELVILDEWECKTITDANKLEDAWIAKIRAKKHPLTNVYYSHRMNPKWYTPQNPKWKSHYASSPDEYIQRLKSGDSTSIEQDNEDKPDKEWISTRRKQRYSRKNKR